MQGSHADFAPRGDTQRAVRKFIFRFLICPWFDALIKVKTRTQITHKLYLYYMTNIRSTAARVHGKSAWKLWNWASLLRLWPSEYLQFPLLFAKGWKCWWYYSRTGTKSWWTCLLIELSYRQITKNALAGSCPLSLEAVDIFLSILVRSSCSYPRFLWNTLLPGCRGCKSWIEIFGRGGNLYHRRDHSSTFTASR